MKEPWRYACPECGSRQVRRRTGGNSRGGNRRWVCERDTCDERAIDAVDLKRD